MKGLSARVGRGQKSDAKRGGVNIERETVQTGTGEKLINCGTQLRRRSSTVRLSPFACPHLHSAILSLVMMPL